MSTSLSKSLSLSSYIEMGQKETNRTKQGIVSILGFDSEKAKPTTSLRRTLSADMSSRKWLEQSNFASPMKKIASSEEFSVFMGDHQTSFDDEDLERPNQFEVWSSIQEAKKMKELEDKKQASFDVWSSILTQKDDSSKSSEPPYVHPLVKRSASSLSVKSLEVCTERLGSESGSDGFSYPPSETEDDKEEEQDQQQQQKQEKVSPTFEQEGFSIVKYHYADRKRVPPRSFPPPLPSLSYAGSASLHMKPRRVNGRLVLEAVSVPSQNNFHAQRQDGRLVLTFVDTSSSKEDSINQETTDELQKNGNELEEIFADIEEDEEKALETDDEEDEEAGEEDRDRAAKSKDAREEMEYVKERSPKLSSGTMSVQRLALIASKPMALVNRNSKWSNKLNEEVEVEDNQTIPFAKSLPPRPPASRLIPKPPVAAAKAAAATGTSLNAYEYGWRAKPTAAAAMLNPTAQETSHLKEKGNKFIVSKNLVANEQQQLQLLRGSSADRFVVPLLKGCKEARRSLLFLEPHCIATS